MGKRLDVSPTGNRSVEYGWLCLQPWYAWGLPCSVKFCRWIAEKEKCHVKVERGLTITSFRIVRAAHRMKLCREGSPDRVHEERGKGSCFQQHQWRGKVHLRFCEVSEGMCFVWCISQETGLQVARGADPSPGHRVRPGRQSICPAMWWPRTMTMAETRCQSRTMTCRRWYWCVRKPSRDFGRHV